MKISSAEHILEHCKWINPNLLVFELYSGLNEKYFPVELHFNSSSKKKEIRQKTIDSIKSFQSLDESNLLEIQNAVWRFLLKYKSEDDLKHLGIHTKEDAIQKSQINGVGFINEDELDHTFFYIFLKTEWDQEHGITISYFNGKLDDVE